MAAGLGVHDPLRIGTAPESGVHVLSVVVKVPGANTFTLTDDGSTTSARMGSWPPGHVRVQAVSVGAVRTSEPLI
jgi:hypothetical protein